MTKLPQSVLSLLLGLPAFRLFIVFWGGMALVALTQDLAVPAAGQIGLLALLVAACSLRLRVLPVLALTFTAWLVVNGFVEHEYGALAFTGTTDLLLLALLLGAGLAGEHVR